jgi:hypothetical protein
VIAGAGNEAEILQRLADGQPARRDLLAFTIEHDLDALRLAEGDGIAVGERSRGREHVALRDFDAASLQQVARVRRVRTQRLHGTLDIERDLTLAGERNDRRGDSDREDGQAYEPQRTRGQGRTWCARAVRCFQRRCRRWHERPQNWGVSYGRDNQVRGLCHVIPAGR